MHPSLMLPNTLFHWLLPNTRGSDFVVGDIHGHVALLDCLLEAVHFDPASDRVIALGDLIDRGPQSRVLLERVRDEPWFYSLRGNHEAMLKAAIGNWHLRMLWTDNGGDWGEDLSSEDHHALANIVDDLPIGMSVPLVDGRRVGLVHAELHVRHQWEDLEQITSVSEGDAVDDDGGSLAAAALWGRSRITALARLVAAKSTPVDVPDDGQSIRRALQAIDGIDLLIAGHSVIATKLPVQTSNLLWVDTGSYLPDGRLSLVEPLTGRYWQSEHGRQGSASVLSRGGKKLPRPIALPPWLGRKG